MSFLGIDYGSKRMGLAITDPQNIIASPLNTVNTEVIFDFIEGFIKTQFVEKIIVGNPFHKTDRPNEIQEEVNKFISKLKTKFKDIQIETIDERLTTKIARKTSTQLFKKKDRLKNKGYIDQMSAAILLQDYINFCVK